MKINELSKQTGINLETIHYYEKIGVLPEPKRQANGYRFYDENSLQLPHFIKICRSLGFSIEDIKRCGGSINCAAVRKCGAKD